MSGKEEIDWGLVAKKVVQVLGVETARGFYYGIISNAVVPAVIEKVREYARGGDEKKLQELRELLMRQPELVMRQPIAQQYQPLSQEELTRRLAEAMRASYGTQTLPQYLPPTQYPPPSWPQYPPPSPQPPQPYVSGEIERLKREIEELKREIEVYENARLELLKQKLTEFDPEKQKQLEDRIRDLERDIEQKKARLLSLQASARGLL